MTLSVTHTFTPKTNAKSSQVNTNFGDITTYVNNLEATLNAAGNVSTTDLADLSVTTVKLANDAVTASKLADDVSVDANRAVTTDHIRDSAITAAKIAVAVAGNGLTGGGGSALAVNVDNSTIEVSSDTVQVKDAGITEAKLASAVSTKLGQNIGLVARTSHTTASTSYVDVLNYTGQGRLDGVGNVYSGTPGGNIKIIVDGVDHGAISIIAASSPQHIETNVGNSTTMFQDVAGAGKLNELGIFFKTSIQVQHACGVGTTSSTTYVQYEKQA